MELLTAKKPSQLVILDMRLKHEVGIVVFELIDCAISLAPAVNRL
jgi:hypothetical protein